MLLLFCCIDASYSTIQDLLKEKLALCGLFLNTYGRIYKNKHPYPIENKLEVAFVYGHDKRNQRRQRSRGRRGVLLLLGLPKNARSHVHFFEKLKGNLFLPRMLSILTLKEQ